MASQATERAPGRTAAGLVLAEVTLGRHLAVCALAGVSQADMGEVTRPAVAAMPDRAAERLAGALFAGGCPPWAERDALDALVEAGLAAWLAEAERQTALGTARAREVSRWTGQSFHGGALGPPPPPEALAGRLSLEALAGAWALPLWAVVLHGAAAVSLERFDRATATN